MKHSPFHRPQADDDDSDDDDDVDASAAEDDDEEELLIANPRLYQQPAGTPARVVAISTCVIFLWLSASAAVSILLFSRRGLLRGRSLVDAAAAVLLTSVMKWASARIALLFLRKPPLQFNGWQPYMASVAAGGMLSALDVGLMYTAQLTCGKSLLVVVRASVPFWQLLALRIMGLERLRADWLGACLLVAVGGAFTSIRAARFDWGCAALLLASAVVTGLRCTILQRVLHGSNVPGLLPWRQVAQPVQLAYALGPWETISSLAIVIMCKVAAPPISGPRSSELSSLMPECAHTAHIQPRGPRSFTLQLHLAAPPRSST